MTSTPNTSSANWMDRCRWMALCYERQRLIMHDPAKHQTRIAEIDRDLIAKLRIIKTNDGDAITALVNSDAIEVLRQAIHFKGSVIINLINGSAMHDAVRQGRFGILDIHMEHGYGTSPFARALIVRAIETDDPDLLDRMVASYRIDWCHIHSITLPLLLEGVGPKVAPKAAAAFRADLQPDAADLIHITSFVQQAPAGSRLKAMAMIAAAGAYLDASQTDYPVAAGFLRMVNRLPIEIGELLTGNGSNHGRLKLAASEPSLEDILMRKPDQDFFGLKSKDVQVTLASFGIS